MTDVDGVLTDGGMYYSSKGDIMKKFHARDGMGITLLRKKDLPTVLVTKEKTEIVKQWATKMKVEKLFDGVLNKELVLMNVCKKFNISPKEVAYIGDDVNDIDLLKKVGLSAAPKNSVPKARAVCDYTCKVNGGEGAFRELADLILKNQG